MMTVAGLPASRLTSKAWEWTDTAPWSKRTVSYRFQYDGLGNGQFTEREGMYFIDGSFVNMNLPEKYDTDTYIAPVNIRLSCGGIETMHNRQVGDRPSSSYEVQPKYAVDVRTGRNSTMLLSTSMMDSPMINYPLPPYETYNSRDYQIAVRVSIPDTTPVSYFVSHYVYFTITYDIYYRDSSGGNLPDGWSENTTAPAATLPDDLPTVTTAAPPEDTAEQITGLLEFPSSLLDGMHYLRDTISQILGLRYVSFVVVLGLICALVAWFLH